MFEIGDAIVHPVHGAGVVTDVDELELHGGSEEYYRIELLGERDTNLIIPVRAAKARGLRAAIQKSGLDRVWRVLRATPKRLPAHYKERYEFVRSKLRTGDLVQVVEVVRDMAWRLKREGRLNTRGKRMYEKGIKLLAGEVAASQGTDLSNAETQVREHLRESLYSEAAV